MTPGGASLPCSPRPSVLGRLPLRAARVPGAVPAARQAPSRRRCSKPPLPSQPHPRCPGERTGGEGPGRIHSLAGSAARPQPRLSLGAEGGGGRGSARRWGSSQKEVRGTQRCPGHQADAHHRWSLRPLWRHPLPRRRPRAAPRAASAQTLAPAPGKLPGPPASGA